MIKYLTLCVVTVIYIQMCIINRCCTFSHAVYLFSLFFSLYLSYSNQHFLEIVILLCYQYIIEDVLSVKLSMCGLAVYQKECIIFFIHAISVNI